MNPFRSVGARLSLALAAVVAAALAIVYVALVPTLERRLSDGKLSQLRHAASGLPQQYAESENLPPGDFVASVASSVNGQVLLFTVLAESPLTLSPIAYSLQARNAAAFSNDPIALRAAAAGRLESGLLQRGDESYAEAAIPLPDSSVVLLTSSLHDTLADVHLVQRRLIVAGLLALVASVALGFGVAAFFARRIRRLERAAERIAGGDFSEPVVDTSVDELGELARAFDRMRGRLAQLDGARRAFIANASHELRTPIFSLGGFLELLQDEDIDEATRAEFLVTMTEQVERLTKLATELLDLSRLDAGRLRVEPEEVELAELARALVDEFHAVALARSHSLEAIVEAHAIARADPERTLQIGRILIENALRHTPGGTPVRVIVRAPAQLVVEDEGPGIPVADFERVFERFTRLDGAIASGSGLGLAIARELAGRMGGSIRLTSTPGSTAFALVLPAGEPAAVSRESQPAAVT